ncbi:histidinol-phosphatase HisJ [Cohnella lubricantis]|uniref:Histidinol-phosphatase n=1 Tax=Cohnella lubricantis TaxID=2163172 RepID=A0A841T974_9BACL|nr:histidinol-phosphatase HisJ [Cohnella lubricantis]MBB6676619.1 histidinol-phosphatase HisJ [Cohnella lubricantis]MBP2117370.1 histidinol-phosphatase (PHP family) [Cohnella lubricantis]
MLKWDGHTHTRFCYHGSGAELSEYVDRAIALDFERYSVTEHPPLPERWVPDERLMDELAMPLAELPAYIEYVQRVKKQYEGRIELTVGLEMDYLHGSTSFSDELMKPYLDVLEDAVVSVHYLPGEDGMYCVDFTADDLRRNLLPAYGSMDSLADAYFDHMEQAIAWASKLPMRKRVGHPLLIQKFRTELPPIGEALLNRRLERIVRLLAESGVGLDVNTAGLRVPTCGQAYAPDWFVRKCQAAGVEVVYGSDAHKPEQVGFGYDWFAAAAAGGSGSA